MKKQRNSINKHSLPYLCGSGAVISKKNANKRFGCLKCTKCSKRMLTFGTKPYWGFSY